MASNKSEYKPRDMKVYDSNDFEKLLKGVKVAACMLTDTPHIVDEESVIRRVSALTLGGLSGGEQCSCCGAGPFETRQQQTAHYKHHWHAYNLKRRIFGKGPLSLTDYNSKQDDNSSVSGSDSEADDSGSTDLFAAATRHCKAFFCNSAGQVFCIYRCILHHRKEILSSDGEGHAWVYRCKSLMEPGALRWAVLMVSGGHFAGAVFSGGVPAVHKTMHSYIVRRGQGQAQGARDQHGNAPKSAGASLRRYNQSQFIQHIQEILVSWSEDLAGCSLVLYRASGPINQGVLFGKGSPLTKDDPRVRALPFPTRRPTFKEVQRAHATVANLEVYDTMELFQKALIASTGKPPSKTDGATERSRKTQKSSPSKPPIDRAKSREPVARELPTQILSSEDEGPCFLDSETPAGWIKTLSEQSSNGVITDSRKDLLNDCVSLEPSDDDAENVPERKNDVKKKKKKKEEQNTVVKKMPQKIPNSIKRMWKTISGNQSSLETVLESWACEVGLQDACNVPDPNDGNTALHKAAIAAKPDMVTEIMSVGGDPCMRNHSLHTPYASAIDQDTRLAFRRFQASHPDKYNYAKSHIPGPVTPESLAEERERKAQQKRAKRLRDKLKQSEKNKSNKFLQMTDTQKAQACDMPRCFLCGSKVPRYPFEYDQYRFCSTKCLQNHRNVRPLNLPA